MVLNNNNWMTADSGKFEQFEELVSQVTSASACPLATDIQKRVPIYQQPEVLQLAAVPDSRQQLLAEWAQVLKDGPGIFVVAGALADRVPVIDRASVVFQRIITEQIQAGKNSGDHFAKPGANDRIWNTLEKHCLADPENFAHYFGALPVGLACEAWLGPGYQLTAQVNQVNPGGKAQVAHRDYHLGFMSQEQMLRFPMHVHELSPLLTLQAAIAHVDMPLDTGPTLYLPYSQRFCEGYVAFQRPEFQAYFKEHHSQLSLKKGDAVFFNPALMHAAGENKTTSSHRLANLIQASSMFGIAMESINRLEMMKALYPYLLQCQDNQRLSPAEIDCALSAAAAAYAFPTNLDTDPPENGLAPLNQAGVVRDALSQQRDSESLISELTERNSRRSS